MEPFEIDSQTLSDLEIFESAGKGASIFSLFDHCATPGGRRKLHELFSFPLTDPVEIADRQMLIAGLETLTFNLEVSGLSLDLVAHFMAQAEKPKAFHRYAVWKDFLLFRSTQAFYNKQRGVHELLDLIIRIQLASEHIELDHSPVLMQDLHNAVQALLKLPAIAKAVMVRPAKLKIGLLAECNYIFRKSALKAVEKLLNLIYLLDAYIAVANTAKSYDLIYPRLEAEQQNLLHIKGAYHLFIQKPQGNDIRFAENKNVFFLTGSNMAGKSTLLKSVGICIYLAHLGFPVPAADMNFSLFKGLVSTINLPDNLMKGYSHFYTEVKRVREVAEKVGAAKPMVVIFDELFRGTNVKDAYDGSLAIIKAFAQLKSSFFMISTHIVEVAHELQQHQGMDFNYMETDLSSGKPVFSYQLKAGITEERMGMWIINNEGIVDILNLKSGEI